MHLTNSELIFQKWAVTQGYRTSIISHTTSKIRMTKKHDVSNDLVPNRIKKSILLIKDLTQALQNHINPFMDYLKDDTLFNISTGRAAPDEIGEFLVNIPLIGKKKE